MNENNSHLESLHLTPKENGDFQKLEQLYNEMKQHFNTLSSEYPNDLESRAATLAFELYKSLKKRGIEVEYSKVLIENRKEAVNANPDQFSFYQHFHSIEQLVKYIQWPGANREIGDVTMGHEYTIQIFSKRGGNHHCSVQLTRYTDGWKYSFRKTGETNKRCEGLFDALSAIEYINYPHQLGNAFEHIWNEAESGNLDIGELKMRLNDLAEWISTTNKASPKWFG